MFVYPRCESVSASERQDGEHMPRKTGTRQGRTPPTGDPHKGEDPAEDPPPEGRATQGTHTDHRQTSFIAYNSHHKIGAQGGRIALAQKVPARGHRARRGIQGENPPPPELRDFFFYTIVLRTQPNTLGRGAPSALRPPWRPSVPALNQNKE